ncbi:hypothetical protein [Marinobacter sp. W-8]|uniref:hypothetical protein n=1 Tax=Marinobacter sp. W-8 TaxID=3369658 RepID=UPI0037C8D822
MAQVQKTHERFDQQPERSRASQKDLFNLAGADATKGSGLHLKTIQGLAREGIQVVPAGHNHWILTGNRPLPEVHCYSEQELQRFARSPARHYLTNLSRENL